MADVHVGRGSRRVLVAVWGVAMLLIVGQLGWAAPASSEPVVASVASAATNNIPFPVIYQKDVYTPTASIWVAGVPGGPKSIASGTAYSFSWSPDGRYATFALPSAGSGLVYRFDAATGAAQSWSCGSCYRSAIAGGMIVALDSNMVLQRFPLVGTSPLAAVSLTGIPGYPTAQFARPEVIAGRGSSVVITWPMNDAASNAWGAILEVGLAGGYVRTLLGDATNQFSVALWAVHKSLDDRNLVTVGRFHNSACEEEAAVRVTSLVTGTTTSIANPATPANRFKALGSAAFDQYDKLWTAMYDEGWSGSNCVQSAPLAYQQSGSGWVAQDQNVISLRFGPNNERVWVRGSTGSAGTLTIDTGGIRVSVDVNVSFAEPSPTGAGVRYAALGDSYSSGEGAPAPSDTFLPGTNDQYAGPPNTCHRSVNAYPNVLRQMLSYSTTDLALRACSGATIDAYWGPNRKNPGEIAQRQALGPQTSMVTLTFGGNDVGFAPIIEWCLATPSCQNRFVVPGSSVDRVERRINTVYPALLELYNDVKARTQGRATIYAFTYPQILPTTSTLGCGLAYPLLSNDELAWMREKWTQFNNVIRRAADATGIRVVDVENDFAGHDICALSNPAANNIDLKHPAYSFHPNALGHTLMAEGSGVAVMNPPGRTPTPQGDPGPTAGEVSMQELDGIDAWFNANTNMIIAGQYGAFTLPKITGWSTGSTVKWTVFSNAVPIGTSTADASGTIAPALNIPAGLDPGRHTVVAEGTAPDGSPRFLTFPFTVTPGSGYHPMTPFRALDSRTSVGGFNGPLTAAAPKPLSVAGVQGIPSSASAVVMNVTATNATSGSFVTAYPDGESPPNASNLNFGAGQTIANLVTVKVGTGGKIRFANAIGAVDVVADVVGYYDDGNGPGVLFNGRNPVRVLDSRTPTGGWSGPLNAGNPRELTVQGSGAIAGIPVFATTVVANVTVTASTTGSFLSVWPSGVAQPNSSNINFGPGQTIANLVTVKIGTNGKISFANAVGSTHVIVDVVGYYDQLSGSRFHPVTPTRFLDDRAGTGVAGPWGPGQTRPVTVAGAVGIPTAATEVVANLTATAGTTGSFATAYPQGSTAPNSSNLNFGPGETIPNLVLIKVGTGGQIALRNEAGSVDLVGDVVGYFAPT